MRRAVKRIAAGLALAALTSTPAAHAKKKTVPTWTASRVTDPITDVTSCKVSATDAAAGLRMTRTGTLYPVVELHSELGLLVGVSSGGSYRVPTGDIVWRVDDKPFHQLKAAENPVMPGSSAMPANVAEELMQRTTSDIHRMIASATATSTMASGEKAKAMLAEMIAGTGLIYRSVAVQQFGLADPRAQEVGQITKDGLKPIPLDASFHAALAVCGINSAR